MHEYKVCSQDEGLRRPSNMHYQWLISCQQHNHIHITYQSYWQ